MNRGGLESVARVTDAVPEEILNRLVLHRVYLEGRVLKPNMVISGKKNASRTSPEEVTAATIRCGAASSGKHDSAQEAQVA
jgi:fructose-bisphosphate aldolase class I